MTPDPTAAPVTRAQARRPADVRTAEEAIAEQERLRPLVRPTADPGLDVRLAAGLDVGYADDDRLVAAIVVVDVATMTTLLRGALQGAMPPDYLRSLAEEAARAYPS